MGRRARFTAPDKLYFVTNKTINSMYLMRPSTQVNATIGAVLARAAEMYGVEVFAFVFLSNHFHMIVRSTNGLLPRFMQFFESRVATLMNPIVGWSGSFWQHRYKAVPILDDEAAVQLVKYILKHGVKEGLVRRHAEWPGLSAFPQLTGCRTRQFTWPGKSSDSRPGSRYTIKLAPLPMFENLPWPKYVEQMQALAKEAHAEAVAERGTEQVLGPRAILEQNPFDRPLALKSLPARLCHAACRRTRQAFIDSLSVFYEAYAYASQRFRGGDHNVCFPEYAHRPPLIWRASMAMT